MTRGHQSALVSGTPSRGSANRASVSIGQVLDALSSEFPDVSPSKIRFLEAEGLIQPLRSSSGYRRFSVADIERLRFILTAQRDEYLPLRVIKERLDALDGALDGTGAGGAVPAVVMTRSELLAAAGAAEDLLAELEDYGLIRRARSYGTQALSVLRSAVKLGEHGIQPRHLRVVKAAVERESALIEQAVAPLTRQKGSREPALRAAQDIAGHIASLHATLIEDGLSEAGLASQPPHPGTQSGESREAPGLRSASGR
ncbi:MerR family transcriptional regulator [Trebonia kvetii]|uniref:MerR family transcriptional regulator n=1 Tax=Trebonia kvetii TaxID=2480626 RepID=A0A6P2BPC4_9ACTN|nr:MerR family transcriptional regulator [Trebonia kvetii]